MKKLLAFSTSLLFLLIISCKNKGKGDIVIDTPNCLIIKVLGDIYHPIQYDSIFSGIKAIPLETKPECILSTLLKVRFFENKILLLDRSRKLSVFSAEGKFLYMIGKQGRGPGEFLTLRDFDIEKLGNVYILDYQKILVYDLSGDFIKKCTFNFMKNEAQTRCNPLEFAVKSDGNFYIWGGSFSIDKIPKDNYFGMFEITEKGRIVNKYMPIKYNIPQGLRNHRFIPYAGSFLIDPIFGSNTIYSIDNEGFQARYKIDFGNKTLDIPVPEGFSSLKDFAAKVNDDYYQSIENFNETDEWIYFLFSHKSRFFNVYYSKKLNKTFVSGNPSLKCRLAPSMISDNYDNKLIGFIDPKYVIDRFKDCNKADLNSASESEKLFIKKPTQIKITDNPILLICTLRNYN